MQANQSPTQTIYASKTPRDLNHDPKPMIDPFSGVRFSVADELLGYEYHPRPEFDHVQHNEPNPILVNARGDAISVYGSQRAAAEAYLDHINERSTVRTAAAGLGVYRLPHIDHARRVLTRLANLPSATQSATHAQR